MNSNDIVLIIDDEIDLTTLLKAFFKKKNYDVFVAHDLQSGLQLIGEKQPGIIFLDNNLPDGVGWQHAEKIAQENPESTLFLISGFHSNPLIMPENANYHVLEKPISYRELDVILYGNSSIQNV